MILHKLLQTKITKLASRRTHRGMVHCTNNTVGQSQRHFLQISTTKGTPSSSTNLKEALCEKIPIYYDLLRNFRQQYGSTLISQITVDNMYDGLKGICTMVREPSEIDSKYGMKYRGLTIAEIMRLLPRNGNSPSPEAVFWLLLTGDVPTQEQAASLIADWTSRRRKRKEWWSGNLLGGIVGNVLRTLPTSVSPLRRFSIALTALDADKHMKEAADNGALEHTHWEYTYEDSMELLAVLPAIVGLVAKNEEIVNVDGDGDWVNFLLDCLSSRLKDFQRDRSSLGDFLRLYIALNADEDGGVPGVHVTQILGSAKLDANEALAGGVLAYANEPKTGTLTECMDFQMKVQSVLGRSPKTDALGNFLLNLTNRDNFLIGHKESSSRDPRYDAILNYVNEFMPDFTEAKLSQDITRVFTTIIRETRNKHIYPDQNALAAPVFQFYGLEDMKFNQVLLCMSRALGAVASIIWARVINAPVEHPRSFSTSTYFEAVLGTKKKSKQKRYGKKMLE